MNLPFSVAKPGMHLNITKEPSLASNTRLFKDKFRLFQVTPFRQKQKFEMWVFRKEKVSPRLGLGNFFRPGKIERTMTAKKE